MDVKSIKKNILYICTPSSIHDKKWISFFASQQEKYNVYVVYEAQINLDKKTIEELKKSNINVLSPINTFSILKPLLVLKSIFSLRKYIHHYKINVIHILFATPYAIWANFISVPYIITTRGSDVLVVLPELKTTKGIKGIYYNRLLELFKKAFVKASSITCTSLAQAQKVKELFAIDNCKIIRTGVDVEKIVHSKDQTCLNLELVNRKFIFSPRFFLPIYNIECQLKAIRRLPQEIINDYVFVFIKGENYDIAYAEMITKEMAVLNKEIGFKYIIESYLNQQILWTYFNFATLTIMSPISDGTPNSALEAMAAKCPLIIPNLNYDNELFYETCFVFNSNDYIDLAELIVKALKEYPQNLIDNAFKNVSLFGNRTIEMNKLNSLYDYIIKS